MADLFGLDWAVAVVWALTFASGAVVALRIHETGTGLTVRTADEAT